MQLASVQRRKSAFARLATAASQKNNQKNEKKRQEKQEGKEENPQKKSRNTNRIYTKKRPLTGSNKGEIGT